MFVLKIIILFFIVVATARCCAQGLFLEKEEWEPSGGGSVGTQQWGFQDYQMRGRSTAGAEFECLCDDQGTEGGRV